MYCNGNTIILISIHVLREEDDGGRTGKLLRRRSISIHVLREEDDADRRSTQSGTSYFNPRPPRGGRLMVCGPANFPVRFQSTSSARRTTQTAKSATHDDEISIHVLREEDDKFLSNKDLENYQFQSTSSARRTTTKIKYG